MQDQILLVVDDTDQLLGYASRTECHTGNGKNHRAFVTLLFTDDQKVLLQRRKHKLFDNLWDFTAISHPLHANDHDETYQEASDRALKKEFGIPHADIKKVGAFSYFAKDGDNCEHEYCAVLIGQYPGSHQANPIEIYEELLIPYAEFVRDIQQHPQKYTVWAQKGVEILEDYFAHQAT